MWNLWLLDYKIRDYRILLFIIIFIRIKLINKGKYMFKKYPSIINYYSSKEIEGWLKYHPNLSGLTYIIEEKLNGSNIQLILQPDGKLLVATRKIIIDPEKDKLFGVAEILTKYSDVLSHLFIYTKSIKTHIRMYAELFGPGVQKGVYYGPEKRLAFFDMTVGDVFLAPKAFRELMIRLGLSHMVVPAIKIVQNLKDVLEFDCEFNSLLGVNREEGENLMEGIVGKPYALSFISPEGSRFCIKRKNKKFEEKQGEKKPKREIPQEIFDLARLFELYITENRLLSVFSKNGPITDVSQIGDYIRWMLEDALEDFRKEVESNIDKQDLKIITKNAARITLEMLKNHL